MRLYNQKRQNEIEKALINLDERKLTFQKFCFW